MMKLRQNVIVTGGSNGIGAAITNAFIDNGASVILADKKEPTIQHERLTYIKTDVSSAQAIAYFFQEVDAQFDHIDILINNAGISKFQPFFELTLDDWDEVMHINLRAMMLFAQHAAERMKKTTHSKSIINIASTRAIMSEPNTELYSASKGAIVAFTHALAMTLQNYHIRVNAISPGWIETGDYSALREEDHQFHPSKRVGKPEDIANACLFLADAKNDFINGENLVIDGGMTRKMIYNQ